MDQNIIILVLILIAILVSFYATYLSMDNSRKIRRLQNDIRDTLGNINSTLNIEKPPSVPTVPKTESRTNLQDLDQFPSLEEIENYDAQRIMEPIDPELKKELDDILTDSKEGEEKDQDGEEPNQETQIEEGMIESLNNSVGKLPEDVILQEVLQSHGDENVVETLESTTVELNVSSSQVEEEPQMKVETNEESYGEEKLNTNTMEELKVEELVPELDTSSEIPVLSLSDANLLQELDDLDPENLIRNKKNNDAETESVVESVMGEADKKKVAEFPVLEELTQDILQKMHDKNVKLICKREGLKVRGTKVERISRILEAKEYKINVN